MPSIVTKTIGTGGDYTTLQSWEDAAPANLVTADQVWRGEVLNSLSGSTSILLTISGGTTDATRYKELTATAGASFVDNANVRTNALRANSANGVLISGSPSYTHLVYVTEQNVHISRLQFHTTNSDSYRALAVTGSGGFVEQCIIETSSNSNSNRQTFEINGEAHNCLIVNRAASGSNGIVRFDNSNGTLRNCTIVAVNGTLTEAFNNNYRTITLINVAVFGTTKANAPNGTTNKTNCYTSAGSNNTGWSTTTYDTSTGSGFENISSGTHDLRIKSTSVLKDAGNNDSNITVDISGFTRSTHDVGAWEYGSSVVTTTVAVRGLVRTADTVAATKTASVAARDRARSADAVAPRKDSSAAARPRARSVDTVQPIKASATAGCTRARGADTIAKTAASTLAARMRTRTASVAVPLQPNMATTAVAARGRARTTSTATKTTAAAVAARTKARESSAVSKLRAVTVAARARTRASVAATAIRTTAIAARGRTRSTAAYLAIRHAAAAARARARSSDSAGKRGAYAIAARARMRAESFAYNYDASIPPVIRDTVMHQGRAAVVASRRFRVEK
ncbi:MAG: hypothetical protein IT518_04695 [Burkholderiales bacterium]|nr:hypothetical protein [Burkholderiales bacterium]